MTRLNNHLDVFWAGHDGNIWSTWWHAGAGWQNHTFQAAVPSTPAGAVTHVAVRMSNHLDVFWIGSDGFVWSTWWHDGSGWQNHTFRL